jgi:hypothetical protein
VNPIINNDLPKILALKTLLSFVNVAISVDDIARLYVLMSLINCGIVDNAIDITGIHDIITLLL